MSELIPLEPIPDKPALPGTVILLDQQNNILSHSDFDGSDINRVYHIS